MGHDHPEQLTGIYLQLPQDPNKRRRTRIRLAPFDPAKVLVGEAGLFGKRFPRQPTLGPQLANPSSQLTANFLVCRAGRFRRSDHLW
jgi:hypothetical protein